MKIVTGYTGTNHVTADDDGGLYASIFGSGCYVLSAGDKFACTVVSATQVHIGSGEGIMYGRHFRTPRGSADALTLDNGATGYNRNDIIAAHYTNIGGYESIELVVLTGTSTTEAATDPAYAQEDISAGATESYMPLYRVRLSGTSIQGVDTLYTLKDVAGGDHVLANAVAVSAVPANPVKGTWYLVRTGAGSGGTADTSSSELKVEASDFNLNSTWTCTYAWTDDGYFCNQSDASTATHTVTFEFEIPEGATVKSAKVHSSWGGTMYGIESRKVAGLIPDADGFVTVSTPDAADTTLSVTFSFVAKRDVYNSHYDAGNMTVGEWTKNHTSSASITDVYLLIELEDVSSGDVTGSDGSTLVQYAIYHAE